MADVILSPVRRPFSIFLLVVWVMAGVSGSFAQSGSGMVTSNDEYEFFLSDYTVYHDASSKLSIEEVSRIPDAAFSFNYRNFNPEIHKTLWLKLRFQANEGLQEKWIYEIFNQRSGEMVLFIRDKNQAFLAVDTIGADVPFYQRNIQSRFPAFEIPVHKGENIIYLRYRSKHLFTLNTIIKPYRNFVNDYLWYYFILGGFYLVLLVLMIYNFFFYLSTRDKVYLYYILFVAVSTLDCLRSDQIGFAILWPEHPEINDYIQEYARALFVFGVINYASYFLAVRKDFPRLHKAVWMVFVLFAIQQMLIPLFFPTAAYPRWISEAFLFSMLLMILYVSIQRILQGHKPVRIFIIGYLSIFSGFVVTYLLFNGWIEGNDFFYYILFYGIFVDTIMFSFSLSLRLRYERQEKERALKAENEARSKVIEHMQQNEILLNKVNKELEEKVRERTVEIEESKRQLAQQAEIIRQWNISLDKENWDLNKKIKELKIRKVIPENQTYAQIRELFSTETDCYTFLADYKWQQGFQCRKCGNAKEAKTNDFYARRCSKCGTVESITANTIFHKLKFPLDKAFYITYSVFTGNENLNVSDLSREIDLNYKTCLKFKVRIEEAIQSRRKTGVKVKSWEDLILDEF